MLAPERAWHTPVSHASSRPAVTVPATPAATGYFPVTGLVVSKPLDLSDQPTAAKEVIHVQHKEQSLAGV